MTQLEKLETVLDDNLNKKAPLKLSEANRKSLAGAMWWLALVAGVLQVWLAWSFWHIAHIVNAIVDTTNSISMAYANSMVVNHLGFFYYLTLITIAVSAVLMLLAAPNLKAMHKQGWNLLFYSLLVNVVFGVLRLFSGYGNIIDLLGALVGSVIGAYLLFQVRDYFMKSDTASHKAKAK